MHNMHVPHRLVARTISTTYVTTTTRTIIITLITLLLLLFGQDTSSMRIPTIVGRTDKQLFLQTTSTRTRTTQRYIIIPQQQLKQRYYYSSNHCIFESTKESRTRTFLSQRYSTTKTTTSKLLLSTNNNMLTNDDDTTVTSTIIGPNLPPIPKNGKRIFWIRHGEVINPGGTRAVYYGSQDVSLSEFGKNEAKLAGQYLSQYILNHTNVYSSTLSRAIYGANHVINYQQNLDTKQNTTTTPTLIQLKELIELDRGEWCGLTIDEIGHDKMKEFDNCNESITPIGGESYSTVYKRVVIDGLQNCILPSMVPGTCTAVISHLQVTRCIVAHALNIPLHDMVSKINIATASITCIDYTTDDTDNNITCTVHYQSFKPSSVIDLLQQQQRNSIDNAN